MLGLGIAVTKPSGRSNALFVNASIQGTSSFVFDGSGDYLEVADDAELSFAAPEHGQVDSRFSFAVWIKRAAINVDECLFSKGDTGALEYRIYFKDADIFFDTYNTSSSNYRRKSKIEVSTTDWQHWVFTYSGDPVNGVTIYLNGSDVGSLTAADGGSGGDMQDLTAAFRIGRMDDVSYDFNGHMMEAVLWKSELSALEVAYLYADGDYARDPNFDAGDYNNNNTVVAWWPMSTSAKGYKDASGVLFASNTAFDAGKYGNVDLDSTETSPF